MTYEGYLIHSSECYHAVYGPQPRNRMTRKKPKYIAKEGNRYFYSQAEYDAFKRGGRINSSRSLYAQSVQKQRNNAKTYGPIQKTGKQNTSLKKEVRKAIQRSRPAMLRLRDAFNKTIMDIKNSAKAVIDEGKRIATNLLIYADDATWRTRKRISERIEEGKNYLSEAITKISDRTINRAGYKSKLITRMERYKNEESDALSRIERLEKKKKEAKKYGSSEYYQSQIDLLKSGLETNTRRFLDETRAEYKKTFGENDPYLIREEYNQIRKEYDSMARKTSPVKERLNRGEKLSSSELEKYRKDRDELHKLSEKLKEYREKYDSSILFLR